MAETSIVYHPRDADWRLVLKAWKVSLGLYNAIGATVTAQHYEESTFLFWTSKQWVDRDVDAISVQASFVGILPNRSDAAAVRRSARENSANADVRIFAFGAGLEISSAGTSPAGPGGAADILVRGIRAVGQALIDGASLACPEVSID
jgi:hypothetical protein